MTHTFFFQWNVPADNHYLGRPDWYINILARWDDTQFSDKKPIVFAKPIDIDLVDCRQVKNWELACRDIIAIAENHFADLARQQRVNKAKAELIEAGEMFDNPVLERGLNPVFAEILNNNFPKAV